MNLICWTKNELCTEFSKNINIEHIIFVNNYNDLKSNISENSNIAIDYSVIFKNITDFKSIIQNFPKHKCFIVLDIDLLQSDVIEMNARLQTKTPDEEEKYMKNKNKMTKEEFRQQLTDWDINLLMDLAEGEFNNLYNEILPELKFNVFIDNIDDAILEKNIINCTDEQIAKAFKSAADNIKEKICKNMTGHRVFEILELYEYIGPTRLVDVLKAQEEIIGIINK